MSNTRKSLFAQPTTTVDLNPTVMTTSNPVVVSGAGTQVPGYDVAKHNLTILPENDVLMFGMETQKKANTVLDGLLARVTKGNSPVLFEIFAKIEKGVDEVDLGELEKQIRDSQSKSGTTRFLDSIGLGSMAKRMEKAQNKISDMLTSKSTTLSQLVKDMEIKVGVEVDRLLSDSKALKDLSEEFRDQVRAYTELVGVGRMMLENGKNDLVLMESSANGSGDPLKTEEARIFSQKVALFENRLLVLEQCLAKAPVELEQIRLTQGAIYQTTSEVATSAMAEFADIKSALIKLSVAHQLGSVQSMGDSRRKMREKISGYSTDLMEKTALAAAQAQGNNRQEDAIKLLESATRITAIREKIAQADKENTVKFEESRKSLEKVKALIK